ncbi:MAG: hypothetical protein JW743_01010 [Deltaproteobacteria bacterium]|nr:hypothetical protein [Deltaproteobacteria bacterium]
MVIIPLLIVVIFCLPFSSSAKMKPMGNNMSISWTPAPPTWFRIYSLPIRPAPVWFDVEWITFEAEKDPPVAKIVYEDILALFPPISPYFLETHDYSYCTCDSDGLADKSNRHFPNTTAGCVAVDTHAEKIIRSGDAEVDIPTGKGGAYWYTGGEPFLKIYFPGLVMASLHEWEAEIKYGGNCENLGQCQALGTIKISGMTVKVHPGGWVQMWVRKKSPDVFWFHHWRQH